MSMTSGYIFRLGHHTDNGQLAQAIHFNLRTFAVSVSDGSDTLSN